MSADRAFTLLADASLRQYPTEAAMHLESMRPRDVSAVLERVEPQVAADVFRRLRSDRAAVRCNIPRGEESIRRRSSH